VLKLANPSLRQHGFCQCLWLSQGVALTLVNVFNRAPSTVAHMLQSV
jgi:hypothetical protein